VKVVISRGMPVEQLSNDGQDMVGHHDAIVVSDAIQQSSHVASR
jgi:hypothetical protein